jgi:hypothetical protein
LDEGLNVDVSLAESGEGQQSHDGVCQQVVGLKVKVVQEIPEEVAHQESEPSLEVGDEDHPLICLWCWHSFAGR